MEVNTGSKYINTDAMEAPAVFTPKFQHRYAKIEGNMPRYKKTIMVVDLSSNP